MSQLTTADVAGSSAPRVRSSARPPGLLCVSNFPANTGFAWGFIESLYAGVADRLNARGVRTWVAYPEIREAPRTLAGSAARAVELETRPGAVRCVAATVRFIRKNNVRAMYMADRPSWHPAYVFFRLAGVRRIVVHDHTSGQRTQPKGWKLAVKLLLRRMLSAMTADVVIGVSDYVARRKIEVDLVPPGRVRRIWNAVEIPDPNPNARARLRRELHLPADALVVACVCRAAPEKGVEHLLHAFDSLEQREGRQVVLVFMGDGPDMTRLEGVRASLRARARVVFTGYRQDAQELLEGADLAVVPSTWQEAFGLAALEPMARGIPVIATRVGGIPEVVVDGETGVLVAAADVDALAAAMERLLSDAGERQRMGENGRRRAQTYFRLADEIEELTALIEPAYAVGTVPERAWA